MNQLNEAKALLAQAHALISACPCANNTQLVVRYGISRDLGTVEERVDKLRELCIKDPMPKTEGTELGGMTESTTQTTGALIHADDLTPALGCIKGDKVGTITDTHCKHDTNRVGNCQHCVHLAGGCYECPQREMVEG